MKKNKAKISSDAGTGSKTDSRKLFRAGDAVIIILLPALVAAIYLIKLNFTEKTGADIAEVTFGGQVIGTIPLSAEGEYSYPQLEGMVFTVSEGTVFVSESNCSDRICVKSGRLSRPGEAAVCVPNRAAVTVRSSRSENNDIDAVVR